MATQSPPAPAPSPAGPPPSPTTPPSLRAAGTILASLLAVATVLWVTLLLVDELSKDERRSTRDLGALRTVQVKTDSGELTVIPADGDRTTIETVERHGLLGGPDVTMRTEGGRLVIDSDCPGFVPLSCGVDHVLRIPRGVAVELESGSGDIEVEQVAGVADLRTGSGEISLTGMRGTRLTARTGSGDIDIADARAGEVELRTGSGEIALDDVTAGRVEARTGSGDVDLALLGAAPREILTRTGSGEVSMLVPDAAYRVTTRTGSGDEDVQVRQDPDAPSTIDVETGSGDVKVAQR